MPPVSGNIKANKLTLQQHGAVTTGDLVMEVKNSAFTISMGSNSLMTLAPEGVNDVNGSSTIVPSLLTINRDTEIDGDLEVTGKIKVNNITVTGKLAVERPLSDGFKTVMTTYIDAHTKPGTWGQE